MKGIGFRFCDLASMLRNEFILKEKPQLIELVENFRSTNQILKLANSVTKLLHIFFPFSLDTLNREYC